MSFKSKKSPVLEELEKIAIQKGLVTVSVLDKIASMPKKQNYVVAENFDENIIKLCSGLREKGFYAQASLLEEDYVICKQAETAYKDSLDYKKLHDAAHAKTTKLKGIDGDSEVEDIFEIKRKIMDVVNKQPKSKYATLISKIKNAGRIEDKQLLSKHLIGISQLLRQMGALIAHDENSSNSNLAPTAAESCNTKASEVLALSKSDHVDISNLYDIRKFEYAINAKWVENTAVVFSWNNLSPDNRRVYEKLRKELYHRLDWCESLLKKIDAENLEKDESEVDVLNKLEQRFAKCQYNIGLYQRSVDSNQQFSDDPELARLKTKVFTPMMNEVRKDIENIQNMFNHGAAASSIAKILTNVETSLGKIRKAFID